MRFAILSALLISKVMFGFGWSSLLPGVTFTNTKSGSLAATDRVGWGNVADENGSDPFSVSFWMKTSGSSGPYPTVIGKLSTNGYGGWVIYSASSSPRALTFQMGDLTALAYFGVTNTTLTLTDGTWYHVAMTYSGSKTYSGMKIYVNGSPASLSGFNGGSFVTAANPQDMKAGIANGLTYWGGLLDEFSKWPIELTSGNVTEIYNSGKPSDITSLSFYGSSNFASSARSMWVRFENNWNDTSQNAYPGAVLDNTNATFSSTVP